MWFQFLKKKWSNKLKRIRTVFNSYITNGEQLRKAMRWVGWLTYSVDDYMVSIAEVSSSPNE